MEKEGTILQKIFETGVSQTFSIEEKLSVIDAFSQFSQNPTSATAGFGVEKNYPFIGENLKRRYKIGKIAIDNVLAFVRESFEEMRKVNYDVYFWRHAIADYIIGKHTETFLQWYNSLYKKLSEDEKPQFLFLLYALHYTTSGRDLLRWYTCFFDKEERLSQSGLENFLVRWGLGNILYYRSSRGYEEKQFRPSHLLDVLRERYKDEILIEEKQVEDFFENLLISNIRLLERCLKEKVPVYETSRGRVTQAAPLIVESSKSHFGVSPFAIQKIRGLIKSEKENLTGEWKGKISAMLNSFTGENYPYVDLKSIFDVEGAYCWEVRYVDTPDKEPIKVTILLSPYIFLLTGFTTILDEIRRVSSSPLNLIFLLRETLPTIADALSYVSSQRYLIFLFEEKSQKFYVIEKGTVPEDASFMIDSFLSKFLPFLDKEVQVTRTLPAHLEGYMENLKYFNKFPKLVSVRNRMRELEPKLREVVREKFREAFGNKWIEKIKEEITPTLIRKAEGRLESRVDKRKAKDFLDGTTLGELTRILSQFPSLLKPDEKDLLGSFLKILNRHRKVLEHPLKEQEEDLEETTFNSLDSSLKYIRNVLCLQEG